MAVTMDLGPCSWPVLLNLPSAKPTNNLSIKAFSAADYRGQIGLAVLDSK